MPDDDNQPRHSTMHPGEPGSVGDRNETGEEPVPLGTRDPETQRLVLSPKKTMPTAKAFVKERHDHPEGPTIRNYAGILMVWRGNRYVEIEDETLRHILQPWLHEAKQFVKKKDEWKLIDFESNPATINAAVESIKTLTHIPASVTPPVWLSNAEDRPNPLELLPYPSGNLHVLTGQVFTPTPALFNINALDFDYDPNAEVPKEWNKFVGQIWGRDTESIELLQEWFGYTLIADTSQQKMLMLVGPRRSGKGTIGRILKQMVGVSNVVGPTLPSLTGRFGLQPLIGKTLAIVSDAHFTRKNVGVAEERLLCISGEDTLTIDRKCISSVTMKLPTRFMFLTNDLPRMYDASGAFVSRFVTLRMTESFLGREDKNLENKLLAELPGILLWAIEGLKRLRARGHFVEPKAVSEAVREMEDLASPVRGFVRDCCTIATGNRVWVDDLFKAWWQWCQHNGRNCTMEKQAFGRDLAAAVPGVVCRRNTAKGRFYEGIALRLGGGL